MTCTSKDYTAKYTALLDMLEWAHEKDEHHILQSHAHFDVCVGKEWNWPF